MLPNIFIDEYMPSASGSYVKVYLYLVRCIQDAACDISIGLIADHLQNTENDIRRALTYWEKTGLISLDKSPSNEITAITLNEIIPRSSKDATTLEEEPPSSLAFDEVAASVCPDEGSFPAEEVRFEKPTYTETQIGEITSNEEVQWMMHIIEIYLERPLKPLDVQLILYLYESLNFSVELIMYLYEYCVSKNKKNCSYIEAVALAWAKDGIDTVEKAEATTMIYNTNYNAINKAFGLNRTPGAVEQQFINKWINKYKFAIEIIVEACNRTILQTQKPDFKYTDKILDNWYHQGVKKPSDISHLDEEHKKKMTGKINQKEKKSTTKTTNRFNAFPQREYTKEDYSNLEQKLLNIEYVGKKR